MASKGGRQPALDRWLQEDDLEAPGKAKEPAPRAEDAIVGSLRNACRAGPGPGPRDFFLSAIKLDGCPAIDRRTRSDGGREPGDRVSQRLLAQELLRRRRWLAHIGLPAALPISGPPATPAR